MGYSSEQFCENSPMTTPVLSLLSGEEIKSLKLVEDSSDENLYRARTGIFGRSPLALPEIGGLGNRDGPPSMTKV